MDRRLSVKGCQVLVSTLGNATGLVEREMKHETDDHQARLC